MHPLIIAELREERRFAVFAGCGSSGGTGSAGSEGCGFVRRREGLSTQPGILSRQGRLKTESRRAGGAQILSTMGDGSTPARSGRAETGFSEAIQKTGISVHPGASANLCRGCETGAKLVGRTRWVRRHGDLVEVFCQYVCGAPRVRALPFRRMHDSRMRPVDFYKSTVGAEHRAARNSGAHLAHRLRGFTNHRFPYL